MKKIPALVFFIWAINVIKAIVIINNGAWSFKTITLRELYDDVDNAIHMYLFMRDVTKDNDFVIHYYFATETSTLNGTVRFCQADVSTLNGTVAAIAARSLGLDIVDGTPCPVSAGMHTFQLPVFAMEQANSDVFFDNDVPMVHLVMAVSDEDWGIIVDVFTDEIGEKFLASMNYTDLEY